MVVPQETDEGEQTVPIMGDDEGVFDLFMTADNHYSF